MLVLICVYIYIYKMYVYIYFARFNNVECTVSISPEYIYIYYIFFDISSTFCVTFSKRMNGNCLLMPFIPHNELLSVYQLLLNRQTLPLHSF